jgi:hypothetical protein
VAEAYNNLRQRTSIHHITKNMIAHELIKTGKSEGIKETGALMKLFSKMITYPKNLLYKSGYRKNFPHIHQQGPMCEIGLLV